jgi:hypothetical protein
MAGVAIANADFAFSNTRVTPTNCVVPSDPDLAKRSAFPGLFLLDPKSRNF